MTGWKLRGIRAFRQCSRLGVRCIKLRLAGKSVPGELLHQAHDEPDMPAADWLYFLTSEGQELRLRNLNAGVNEVFKLVSFARF